jgi:cold shock CspA family protein
MTVDAERRLRGVVTKFDWTWGFGFITSAGRSYFVRRREVRGRPTLLLVGEEVAFTVADNPKGPEATRVLRTTPPRAMTAEAAGGEALGKAEETQAGPGRGKKPSHAREGFSAIPKNDRHRFRLLAAQWGPRVVCVGPLNRLTGGRVAAGARPCTAAPVASAVLRHVTGAAVTVAVCEKHAARVRPALRVAAQPRRVEMVAKL